MPRKPPEEQTSLLARAKSTVLNTFSNKQRDFLKQRLQAVEQNKADIIITALFFHIGLDLSYFEKRRSKEKLKEEVIEALDQVNNNMDDSNNMNQAGSNDSETQKMWLKIKLAEIQNQTATAEARKAEAEARKTEAETKTQVAYAATARARTAAARMAAMRTTDQISRAAINISRDNAIASGNLTRMLDRQNDNMADMMRENNILCSPAGINYQPRRFTHAENESIDLMPRGDSVSNEEDRLRPLAEVVIPQNFDRESNPEGSNRPTRSSPNSSPSFARGGVSSEEFASAFGVNRGGNENVAVANGGGNNENVPVANRGGNENVAVANDGGNENVAVNNEEEIIDQGPNMPLFANSGSTRNTRSMKRRRIMRGG